MLLFGCLFLQITNNLSSSQSSPKAVLEENSFMMNYVNNKLASYDNYQPTPQRPSSAIGVTKPEVVVTNIAHFDFGRNGKKIVVLHIMRKLPH